MKIIENLSGKWNGEYVLGAEYGPDEGKCFEFVLELSDQDGEIEGTCFEPEISELFDSPITINGFYEEGLLSFVKQYPCLFYSDQDGKPTVDKNQEHAEISYSGEYDEKNDIFTGEFGLVVESVKHGDGWLETVLRGTWTLKKSI